MKALYGLAALAVAGGLSVAATPAAANGPDGIIISCSPGSSTDTATSCSGGDGHSANAASVVLSPVELLTATATNAGSFANSSAFLGFDYNIGGGSIGDIVNIFITAKMTVSQSGGGSAGAQMTWESPTVVNSETICASSDPLATACAASEVFDGTVHFTGVVGDLQHLQLSIAAAGGFGGTGSATADPTIRITGVTHEDVQYSFEPLPNFGLPPSVPEPAAWALLIGGFAGVGSALRRRRAAIA